MNLVLRERWPVAAGAVAAMLIIAAAVLASIAGRGPSVGGSTFGVALLALTVGLATQVRLDATTSLARERRLVEAGASLREASARLERLAVTDALTGVSNRRGLDERLAAEFNRSRRYARPLSLLMVDIDSFKRINDALGHAFGDVVLAEVADALRSNVRESDVVARYGGEEFAVVLPETSSAAAATVAEKLRACVRERPMQHNGKAVGATVSIGVASLSGESMGVGALVERADQALYAAKRAGKDRVAVSGIEA
ncbi:MAG: GGDEF domain-containing protein [Dehalococcoidia bacterium]